MTMFTPLRALLAALALATAATPSLASMLISQVYGGGGNAGATIRQDFIELKNAGNAAVNLGGWSVQYASANGTSWQVTVIPAGTTVPAGGFLLIQQAQGAGGTVNLVPDVTGTIPMAGGSGKVALSNGSTALSGAAPVSTALVDIVSYGNSTPTNGTPTAALSNTTAAIRGADGCTNTSNNNADFTVAAPAPRNSATTAVACGGGGGEPPPPPPDPLAVAIYTIQGSGALSPLAGQTVVTSGVVTRVNSNGFFIQDLLGDGNPATSDGLFVFTGSASFDAVAPGNLVQVTGPVTEFANGAGTAATPLTQIASPTAVVLLGSGNSITPVDVALPIAPGDTLERFENMLVRITTPMTVQQNFFQARFGQVTLGAGGRHETPTNRHPAGSAQALALDALQARSRILLDDGSALQNPNPTPYFGPAGMPRAGDTATELVGVLDFGLATASSAGPGLYRLQPTESMTFTATNPRPASPPAVGGNVRAAAMNVLNYFTTFTDGTTASGQSGQGCTLGASVSAGNCRGANNLAEFQRQQIKIVRALAALDADALGLVEIQNSPVAVTNLVNALNAFVGAPTWAAVPSPAFTGTDAIQLAILYKPARLTPVGPALSDPDPVNNRPTLAQTFAAPNGERFALLVNHLKSKGSCPSGSGPDADQGDGQGCWNATRTAQAERLVQFAASVKTAGGTSDVLVVGDLNAYGQEDPIQVLLNAGYVDQKQRFTPLAYTYIFDGMSGRLDHALASASLSAKVAFAAAWAINADEQVAHDYNLEFKQPACATCAPDPYDPATPYRSSDHDPSLVGLNIYKRITGTVVRDRLIGTVGDDLFIATPGADLLVSNGGADLFAYTAFNELGDTIMGFAPGASRIDLRTLLASLGWKGTDPVADGWLRIGSGRGSALIEVDPDGPGGAAPFAPALLLNGVSPAQFVPARDLIVR